MHRRGGPVVRRVDLRVGVEVQVHFAARERDHPWLGYGLGFESSSASASGGGAPTASESFTGSSSRGSAAAQTFACRRFFGIGPFVEIDFGTYYARARAGSDQSDDVRPEHPEHALHEWITLGVRGVIFP